MFFAVQNLQSSLPRYLDLTVLSLTIFHVSLPSVFMLSPRANRTVTYGHGFRLVRQTAMVKLTVHLEYHCNDSSLTPEYTVADSQTGKQSVWKTGRQTDGKICRQTELSKVCWLSGLNLPPTKRPSLLRTQTNILFKRAGGESNVLSDRKQASNWLLYIQETNQTVAQS